MVLTIVLSVLNTLNLAITSTEALVKAMYERYHNNYNKSITFIQKNIDYKENGEKVVSVMYEAHHYPGKYRVDYGFIPNRSGYIYGNDSLYHFENGTLTNTYAGEHDIILLTGDIFYIKPEKALEKLKKSGFDITKFRLDTLEGKKMYVVGTLSKTDTISPQFWIDTENLYLARYIKKNELTSQIEDHHFIEHQKIGDAWIEDRVLIYVKGKIIREELYTEVRPNNELEPTLFNPKYWGKVHWHKK